MTDSYQKCSLYLQSAAIKKDTIYRFRANTDLPQKITSDMGVKFRRESTIKMSAMMVAHTSPTPKIAKNENGT